MHEALVLALLRLYLFKRQRFNHDIANIRCEYQQLLRRYRRHLNTQNKLITNLLILLDDPFQLNPRSVWSYRKNDKWWTEIVPTMTSRQFKENFRIEHSTFNALLHHIGPHLEKSNTTYRTSISVEKRICCALYTLGSSSELRTISNLFGIGKSTASIILHDFCSTLVDLYLHTFIKFPTTDPEIKNTIDGFFNQFGYPMCLGAVDGSHIGIKPPLGSETDYFNYKKFHSVILLAVVNSRLEFTYINIGAPGRCNDSSVYSLSTLSNVIQSSIYRNHYLMINNVKIQSHLIADSAFALDRTLMKPYPDRPNTPQENSLFNYRLSRCRCTVERAFGSLKNRFRSLHRKMEFDLDNTITIIKATAILHNLCIVNGDQGELDWDSPQTIHKKPLCNTTTAGAVDIRQALTTFFLQNPL